MARILLGSARLGSALSSLSCVILGLGSLLVTTATACTERATSGADDAQDTPLELPSPPEPEAQREPATGTATVSHPLGRYQVPWVEVEGLAVADDVVLGPVDELMQRDAAEVGVAVDLWPDGVIPYVWKLYDDPEYCGGNLYFCPEEYEMHELGFMAQVKWRLEAYTPLKLVDMTHCYYDFVGSERGCTDDTDCAPDETCESSFCECEAEDMPEHFIFIAPRDAQVGSYGGDPSCDPVNNNTKAELEYTVTTAAAGNWVMEVSENGGAPQSAGTYVAAGGDDEEDIANGLAAQFSHADLNPLQGGFGILKFEAAVGNVEFEVDITPPMGGVGDIDDIIVPCIDFCSNADCTDGDLCQRLWDGDLEDWGSDYECWRDQCLAEAVGYDAEWEPQDLPDLQVTRQVLMEPNYWRFLHEVQHLAGWHHEQNRSDADEYVALLYDELEEPSCSLSEADMVPSMTAYPDEGWLAHYDFASLMQYKSTTACSNAEECDGMCVVALETANCHPNVCEVHPADNDYDWIKPDEWSNADDENATEYEADIQIQGLGFSYGDQDSIRTLYSAGNWSDVPFRRAFEQPFASATTWGGTEENDYYGSVLVRARLGDEHEALLVGVPDEDDDGDVHGTEVYNAGGVAVYEGTRFAWNSIVPALPTHAPSHWLRPPDPEEQGSFGAAVAAGDFDCDGVAEIAVGAPWEGDDGTVTIFSADTVDPRWKRDQAGVVLEPPSGTGDDRFGLAVSAADVTGDACPELVVGAPHTDGTNAYDGLVYVYERDGSSFTLWDTVGDEATVVSSGQRIGETLVAIDLDGDGKDGLALGAPNWNSNRGRVYVYADPGGGTFDSSEHVATLSAIAAAPTSTRFGASLAVADFETSVGSAGDQDLVVGAAGFNTSNKSRSGAIHAFASTGTGLQELTAPTQATGSLDTIESNDYFGYAVAATDEFVFASAPDESSSVTRHGAVFQYEYISTVPYGLAQLRSDDTTAGCDETHEWQGSTDEEDWGCNVSFEPLLLNMRFGRSLAASDSWLAIGATTFDVESTESGGAFFVFARTSGDTFTPAHLYSQNGNYPAIPAP